MAKKNNPGCQCCEEENCLICADDFDRTDNDNIDTGSTCGWTEVSGAWEVITNKLVCTTAGIALCDTVHPDGDSSMVVDVDIKHAGTGSACDVIVGYVDSSNYFYVRFVFGTGTILIREVSGGSHSTLETLTGVTLAVNTVYVVKVCVNASGDITVEKDSVIKLTAASTGITGTQCGLGCNGTFAATFDNFTFSKSDNAGDAANCEPCRELFVPEDCEDCCTLSLAGTEVLVDLGAGGWTSDLCDCDSIAGEYTAVKIAALTPCAWQYAVLAEDWCEANCDEETDNTWGWSIGIEIKVRTAEGNEQCYWWVDIALFDTQDKDSIPPCRTFAHYETLETEPSIFDCETAGPWTLQKISETVDGTICGGSLPATIQLTFVP